jgi:hypothetical protein
MRGVTWVVVEEVRSGDWGIGGKPLHTEDVKAPAAATIRPSGSAVRLANGVVSTGGIGRVLSVAVRIPLRWPSSIQTEVPLAFAKRLMTPAGST